MASPLSKGPIDFWKFTSCGTLLRQGISPSADATKVIPHSVGKCPEGIKGTARLELPLETAIF